MKTSDIPTSLPLDPKLIANYRRQFPRRLKLPAETQSALFEFFRLEAEARHALEPKGPTLHERLFGGEK